MRLINTKAVSNEKMYVFTDEFFNYDLLVLRFFVNCNRFMYLNYILCTYILKNLNTNTHIMYVYV